MPLVVADTSPIFYLLSIGQIELLHLLFKTVFVPDAVYRELCHPTAPAVLREWVTKLPAWLDVVRIAEVEDISLKTLGAGERAAITLASSIGADLILIDERKGTAAALASGVRRHRYSGHTPVGRAGELDRYCRHARQTQGHQFPLPAGND